MNLKKKFDIEQRTDTDGDTLVNSIRAMSKIQHLT